MAALLHGRLAAGFTNTAVLEKFGLDPKTMPMKPLSVEQCVSEGLSGLLKNRSRIVPGEQSLRRLSWVAD
jgi:uncharacterized protein